MIPKGFLNDDLSIYQLDKRIFGSVE